MVLQICSFPQLKLSIWFPKDDFCTLVSVAIVCYSRAEGSLSKLAELNPYVTLSISTSPLAVTSDLDFLSSYQVSHGCCPWEHPC